MRSRTEETKYLTDKDLVSDTEIDEEGYTLYCKWGSKRRFRIQDPPALFPFGRPQWGKIFVAFVLLACGLFFLYQGGTQTKSLRDLRDTYIFFIMGLLVFIPGVYHVHLVARIWLGTQGYHYDQLGKDD